MLRLRVKQAMADAVAIGRVWRYRAGAYAPSGLVVPSGERPAEQSRFDAAVAAAEGELEKLAAANEIFAAHLELAADPMLMENVAEKIAEGMTAADAVHAASGELAALFAQIDDEYLRARADDVRDVCRRILRQLVPSETDPFAAIPDGSILAADELAPSDTARIDFSRVRGVVTRRGSATSHLAILARNRNLPAVVGLGDDFDRLDDGTIVVLDGLAGELLIAPDEHTAAEYRRRMEEAEARSAAADAYASQPVTTRDGRALAVLANAGSVDEVERAIRSGADGIGLFRSEFLYMQRQDGFPDEQVQTAAYARAAELCGGRPLVIRTLDIGGDKSLPYYRFPEEENPFLGWRAIRVSLELRDMFRTQLRAILRASARGGVRVMFPMIVSLAELRDALALLEECKEELRRQEVPFDDRIPVGVMIETPAAVFMADELAAEVDFFSIGTNDLTQYVLAVDRGNRRIAAMYDTLHPAVVRAMRLTVDAAHRHGCEVGICGEFAGCAAHAELLVGLGVDELSVAPPSVPAVKERIRGLETPQAELTARRAVEAATASEVHELIGVG
ncbi:phosphoenolpyruvate--protein phosphotransferase [Alistipes communis]|uniref:phosphoenolpyruvate--protein phosphotransferase n=1 Tax=Alistipes communis TaxID=2585118 RepID=UPI0026DBEA40|nr:phosphoenolpyruvate--protein phosphotransferase [Alistipes communis]